MSGMNGWLLHNRHTQHQTPAGKTHKYHVASARRLETRIGIGNGNRKCGSESRIGSRNRKHAVPEVNTGNMRPPLLPAFCFSTDSIKLNKSHRKFPTDFK